MRALFSGVTGIRSHQVRMDVIGNNIANVNTTGFKGSRVTFQDVFSQTLSAGSARTSPQQIGLGVGVGSTDLFTGAGSFQLTGRELDLAVEGNGMFIQKNSDGSIVYTRAGNFDWDPQGYLVNPGTGSRVQGWMANNATGAIGTTDRGSLTDIKINRGSVALAQKTSKAELTGNLNAGAAVGDEYTTTLTAYDSLGRAQSLTITFEKTASNGWTYTVAGAPPDLTVPSGSTGPITFNTDGTLLTPATGTLALTMDATDAESGQAITLDISNITQAFAGTSDSDVLVRSADGASMGVLESVSIDASGLAIGVFSNGVRRNLAQIGLANFTNPGGLLKTGASSFSESSSSGTPFVGIPSSGGRGRLVPGNLEMSNVDLSTEFTNMIMTQRGFQANTRIISSADEMLQDLVNLRR